MEVLLMVTSGWRIYIAAPIWDFRFLTEWTLGGWLGGALQWHVAGMWLLAINGLTYLLLNFGTGRLLKKFLPLTPSIVLKDLKAALRGRLNHDDLNRAPLGHTELAAEYRRDAQTRVRCGRNSHAPHLCSR